MKEISNLKSDMMMTGNMGFVQTRLEENLNGAILFRTCWRAIDGEPTNI